MLSTCLNGSRGRRDSTIVPLASWDSVVLTGNTLMAVKETSTSIAHNSTLLLFIRRFNPHEADSADAEVRHEERNEDAEAKRAPPAAPTFRYIGAIPGFGPSLEVMSRTNAQHCFAVRLSEKEERKEGGREDVNRGKWLST